jgi:hypothetical protein
MGSTEESFLNYLRREVDTTGKRYERAMQRVFALTEGPVIERGPKLTKATQVLSEAMRLYLGAIRRLANYASHRAQRNLLTTHAGSMLHRDVRSAYPNGRVA